MLAILTITLPIFILIGAGNLLGRRGVFTPDQFRAMGGLVVNLALPALVIRSLAASSAAEVMNARYLAGYAGGSLVMLAVGLAIGLLLRGRSLSVAAIRSLGMSSSNSAFIGFPVAYQLVGETAGVALALNVLLENLIVIPAALAVAEVGAGEAAGVRRMIARTFMGLLKTPIFVAVGIGMVLVVTGLDLPTPLAKAIDMLANAAAPVALLVIGGSLVGLELRGLASTVAIIAVGKLVLHPLAVWGGLTLFALEGEPLRAAGILIAAAPMLSVFPVLAQKYGEEGPTAAALLVTTVASFFTLSAWLWLVSHHLVR